MSPGKHIQGTNEEIERDDVPLVHSGAGPASVTPSSVLVCGQLSAVNALLVCLPIATSYAVLF